MKTVIRFILLIVLIHAVSTIALQGFQESKKSVYAHTGAYYVSNNRSGVLADPGDLIEQLADSSATIIGTDQDGHMLMSSFSTLSLVRGRAPARADEYVAPDGGGSDCDSSNADGDSQCVGTYAETLTLNGLGDIYLMEPGAKVTLREIRCDREPDKVVADRLADAGFVRLTGENIDQKINAETYSLIELILRIFSATLLIMGGVAWITLILRQVIDSSRQLQALAGFGASPWEIATNYVTIHRKELRRVAWETGSVFLLAGIVSALVTRWYWILLLAAAWMATFALLIASLILVVLVKIRLGNTARFQAPPSILFYILSVAAGAAGYMCTRNGLVIIAAVLLVIMEIVIQRHLMVSSLYRSMGATLASLLVILTVLTGLNVGTISIGIDVVRKENLSVDTTMPFETQIVAASLPDSIEDKHDLHRFAYINPVSGIEVNGERAYPLIYATDLSRYEGYVVSGSTLNDDSVAIGRALATKYNIGVGNTVNINGKIVTITNVVGTEQYAGMMIYMSNAEFEELYKGKGTTYYATDRPKGEVENTFPDGTTIMSKADYRKFYQNSAAGTLSLVYGLTAVILLVSAYIAYKLFSAFIDFIEWKINLMRGFGMSRGEFMRSVIILFAAVALGALLVNLIFSGQLSSHLTQWILDSTDSYVDIAIEPTTIVAVAAEHVILIVLLSVLAHRRITRESIYRQFLRTNPRA